MPGSELLTCEEMYRADTLTIDSGKAGTVLMENAGQGIAREIASRYEPCHAVVLCGPGNNGGDGFVVARVLSAAGWPIRLGLLGDISALEGEAAEMAGAWSGPVEPLSTALLDDAELVIDALFGAGIARPIEGVAAEVVGEIAARGLGCVAVDVPSGIDGNTGAVLGVAPHAQLTITFFRKKPAHVLMPGRAHCGETVVVDIGIEESVLADIAPQGVENEPDLWGAHFPWPQASGHKYDRGHVVVVSGPLGKGGAARLAARGALRIGAGLVTVACPPGALIAHASQLNAVMTSGFEDLGEILADERMNVVALGPGNGVGEGTRVNVLKALAQRQSCVLDADALSAFQDDPASLFDALGLNSVLTPHEGEFRRLFAGIDAPGKCERASLAARECGAVVVLKGPDTVVAAPDGRYAVNTRATPFLATAGSGDVLTGILAGLLGQGMPAFEAACAGVWIHGAAAQQIGPGLIAEDIPETVPAVLKELYA